MRRELQVAGILITLVLVAGTGCKGKAQPAAEASAESDTSLAVALERGACYGRCPEYRVELFESGRVHFNGTRNVAVVGDTVGSASQKDVQELMRFIAESGFASFDTAYVFGSAGCGQYVTDNPSVILWAKVGSSIRKVQLDPGCQGAPRALGTIAARVDSVARTSAWIERKN